MAKTSRYRESILSVRSPSVPPRITVAEVARLWTAPHQRFGRSLADGQTLASSATTIKHDYGLSRLLIPDLRTPTYDLRPEPLTPPTAAPSISRIRGQKLGPTDEKTKSSRPNSITLHQYQIRVRVTPLPRIPAKTSIPPPAVCSFYTPPPHGNPKPAADPPKNRRLLINSPRENRPNLI